MAMGFVLDCEEMAILPRSVEYCLRLDCLPNHWNTGQEVLAMVKTGLLFVGPELRDLFHTGLFFRGPKLQHFLQSGLRFLELVLRNYKLNTCYKRNFKRQLTCRSV